MKKIFFLIFIIQYSAINDKSIAQQGLWTWMNGSSSQSPPGVFGIQGIPSPLNSPPGGYEASMGTDASGNFWYFGGYSAGVHDDVWKFNSITNEWTWMKGTAGTACTPVFGTQGIASMLNTPGNQQWCAASWVDTAGNFRIFGGTDGGGNNYNLLWKYDPSTNMWTYEEGSTTCCVAGSYGTKGVSAPANQPPSRWETNGTWVDANNNLWLFGGMAPGGILNDLWKYSIATGEWTWMKGSNTGNSTGSYGTLGIASATNEPPAHKVYGHWKDDAGNFWMFGGGNNLGAYNDLWMFDPVSDNWTWMGGTNILSDPGHAGTYCLADTLNLPAARFENKPSWKDSKGRFWNYGGIGYSDLWVYDPSCNVWTLVNGDPANSVPADYGIKGIPAATNAPGGLMGAVSWTDTNGGLWLMGGWNSSYDAVNTMWRFVIDTTCAVSSCALAPMINLSSSDTNFCEKQCIDFFDLSTNNPTSWQWFFNGANPDTSTQQNPTNICYNSYGSFNVTLVVCNSFGCDSITYINFIHEFQNPIDSIWGINDTLFSLPAYSYQWFEVTNGIIAGATNQFYVPAQTGSYYCVTGDSIGCIGTSNIIVITAAPIISNSNLEFSITQNQVENELHISLLNNQQCEIILYDIFSRIVLKQSFKASVTLRIDHLANGIYLCELRSDHRTVGKIKVTKQ